VSDHFRYDPLAEESKHHNFEIFERLRHECPVHRHEMAAVESPADGPRSQLPPTTEFWSLLRYDDCMEALQRTDCFSNMEGPGPERRPTLTADGMLLFADDPVHRRQRAVANKAFLPKVVESLRPVIGSVIDDLIDDVSTRGRCDALQDIAIPLTVAMITDMFGAGSDRRADVARWGRAINASNGGGPAELAALRTALREMFGLLRDIVAGRRATLASGKEQPADLLGALIIAEHEGTRFTDGDICEAAMQLFSGGFETTATAIGSGVHLLCTHGDQRARLESDWSLLDHAAEEILRFEPPVEGTFRTTTSSVDIGGTTVPVNAKVRVVYASANRDESVFTDAGAFRLDRPIGELRRHIAFGRGTHSCIGAALARMELTIALRTLFERLPGLELDPDAPPKRSTNLTINGFATLPIRWDPRRVRLSAR